MPPMASFDGDEAQLQTASVAARKCEMNLDKAVENVQVISTGARLANEPQIGYAIAKR